MTDQKTKRINHNDYIELVFLESSRQAVDDLIMHLLDIVREHSGAETTRVFVNNGDVRQAQPIAHLLAKLREHKEVLRVDFPIRVAVLFNMMPIASLLDLFVRSLYTGKIQFKPFSVHDAEGALTWLISED